MEEAVKHLVLLALLGGGALAQDQLLTIDAVPKPIEAPTKTDVKGGKVPLKQSDSLTADFAPDLIRKAIGTLNDSRYYMIHMATLDVKKAAFTNESWNTYQQHLQHPSFLEKAGDPWTDWFKQKRIFGSADAALVYLYWVPGSDECDVFNQALAQIRNDATVKEEAKAGNPSAIRPGSIPGCQVKDALTGADQESEYRERRAQQLAFNLVHERLILGNTRPDGGFGTFALFDKETGAPLVKFQVKLNESMSALQIRTQKSDSLLNAFSYKIAITKKIPTPLANLRDIISFSGIALAQAGEKRIEIQLGYFPFAGGKEFQVEHLPSDMVVSSLTADPGNGDTAQTDTQQKDVQQKELSKNTWDNERRYPLDFSLAFPITSYKEATVDLTNGNITAREIKKQRLAAMIDFSPWWLIDRKAGFETKNIQAQLLPVIMGGIPIAGKPLQHPILAAGMGINKAHFFVGTQFNLKRLPPTAPAAGTADSATITSPPAPVTQRWGTQLVWGLDFSVKTITDLLKSKK